jgi:hypothetical protein
MDMAFLTIQPVPEPPVQSPLQTGGAAVGIIANVASASPVTTAQAAPPATRQRFDDRSKRRGAQTDAHSAGVDAKTRRGQIQDFSV